MKTGLIGKKVFITDKESMYFGEWGIIVDYDGEMYSVAIANSSSYSACPVFLRNEFKVKRG